MPQMLPLVARLVHGCKLGVFWYSRFAVRFKKIIEGLFGRCFW